MSDWHFGDDYDMWLYPPVDWTAPDYDYELPEPIEAANIDGTLLVNAEDAIEQVRRLQAENAKLRELLTIASDMARDYDGDRRLLRRLVQELYEDQCDECDRWKYRDRMRELGMEVNW